MPDSAVHPQPVASPRVADAEPAPRGAWPARVADAALSAHAWLTAVSIVALTVAAVGLAGVALTREPVATVWRLGWTYTGRVCIALGFLAAGMHAASRVGWRRAAALLGGGTLIAGAAELSSTATGWPFGVYRYTPLLGDRWFGLVPLAVPLSWALMAYASLALAARLHPTPARGEGLADRIRLAGTAALLLLGWDLAMDPAMSAASAHWAWAARGPLAGGPVTSWLGWLGVGTAIALAMLAVVPPAEWREGLARDRCGGSLYRVNVALAVAMCALAALWPATVAGGGAALLVALLLRRADRRAGATRAARPPGAPVRPAAGA